MPCLGCFNRIVNHPWATDTTTMAELNYGYDRNSNRLWREDVAAGSNDFDELYTIDGLNRLVDLQRGRLNTNKDAIQAGTLGFAQDWGLDPVGNWDSFDVDSDGNGTDDLAQTRTHNKANEITGIAETAGPTWVDPGYDAAGNTTLMPQVAGSGGSGGGSPADRYDGTYDAWNRLVKLTEPMSTYDGRVGEYEYDARHYRVRRREYSAAGKFVSAYDDYYTSRWQRIETRSTTDPNAVATDVLAQWVWHASADAYVDALCSRERDTTGNGTLDETLYACTDAMFNVVALVDGVSYIVEERYAYEPYGIASVLEPNWTARSTSDYDWGTRFQGLSTDLESGLIYQRYRINHPGIGRFMQRDLLQYIDGMSLYASYMSISSTIDPLGLTTADGTNRRGRGPGPRSGGTTSLEPNPYCDNAARRCNSDCSRRRGNSRTRCEANCGRTWGMCRRQWAPWQTAGIQHSNLSQEIDHEYMPEGSGIETIDGLCFEMAYERLYLESRVTYDEHMIDFTYKLDNPALAQGGIALSIVSFTPTAIAVSGGVSVFVGIASLIWAGATSAMPGARDTQRRSTFIRQVSLVERQAVTIIDPVTGEDKGLQATALNKIADCPCDEYLANRLIGN